jgi:hypothetical protein
VDGPPQRSTASFSTSCPATLDPEYGTAFPERQEETFNGNGEMFVIDPGFYGYSYSSGGFLNSDYSPTNQITATLSTPATAVGLGYGSLSAGGATFALLLSTGDSFTLSTGGSI